MGNQSVVVVDDFYDVVFVVCWCFLCHVDKKVVLELLLDLLHLRFPFLKLFPFEPERYAHRRIYLPDRHLIQLPLELFLPLFQILPIPNRRSRLMRIQIPPHFPLIPSLNKKMRILRFPSQHSSKEPGLSKPHHHLQILPLRLIQPYPRHQQHHYLRSIHLHLRPEQAIILANINPDIFLLLFQEMLDEVPSFGWGVPIGVLFVELFGAVVGEELDGVVGGGVVDEFGEDGGERVGEVEVEVVGDEHLGDAEHAAPAGVRGVGGGREGGEDGVTVGEEDVGGGRRGGGFGAGLHQNTHYNIGFWVLVVYNVRRQLREVWDKEIINNKQEKQVISHPQIINKITHLMHLSTSSYDTSNSIYKHLPAANPILPLPNHPTPQITSPKFIFKQPSRTLSIPRKKFQPFPQPPPDQYLSLLKKPSTSQSHSLSPSKKLIKQTFDWNFQCGNLLSAVKIDTDLYRLTLRPDSNSNHQSLWFYFRVRGLKRVRVILSPFRKKTSLYNEGMKVCWREEKGEWRRGGEDIGYEQEGDHYVLGFRFEGMDEKKWTEMAYCVPYGVTELTDYLNRNITLCESSLFKKQVLTTTLLKRPVYLFSSLPSPLPLKPIILITARVHPGETVSSHIIQGILSTLLLSQPNTLQLLRSYELKILPMLNPDGVSLGNYRCSYSGHDLNRKWKDTHPTYHPEIYKIKKMIEMVKERVVMVIDVHGHSRKKGVFFYGCGEGEAKEFPYLMEKCYPETFSYKKSCFKVQADKEGTLRVHLWKKLKIPRVYTMECSFCGSEGKDNFLREDYERVGEELVRGLIVYYSKGFEKRVVKLDEQRSEIIKKFEEEKDVIVNEQSDSGSDSQPSIGIVEQPQIKSTPKPQKPYYRRISFEPTLREISPPKNYKGFQSVVNQDPRNPNPPPHPSSPIKIKFHPKQPSRPLIPQKKQPSDQRLSNKISTQYKIRISKLLKQTWNNKEEILTNIRSQNEVNFSSEKFFHLSEHRKTETCNFNSELLFPGGREAGKSKGREFFGAQYVRVKKQAEKMNLEKYSSAGERGRGRGRQREEGRGNDRSMEQGGTTGKLKLEVRPLTSSKNIIKMELYDQYF